MKLSFTSQDIDKVEAELIVLMLFEKDVPFKGLLGKLDWRINGRLSDFVAKNHFKGKAKELLLMPSERRFKSGEIMVLGLGKKDQFTQEHISKVLDYFLETIEKKKTEQICFSLSQLLSGQFEWRNAVRLLLSKIVDLKTVKEVILCEPVELVRDAKRRQINVGPQIQVDYL